jgi:hypothetical protein
MATMRRRVHAGTPWLAHRPPLNRSDAATPQAADCSAHRALRPGVRRLVARVRIAPSYTTDPIEKAVFVGFR